LSNKVGERRDPRSIFIQSQPIPEIDEERQPELAAGLQQAQHHVPCQAAIGAHRATRDLALDHAGAQVVLGRIGVQRNLRALKDLQKFVLK
jgi:hypothetical protein